MTVAINILQSICVGIISVTVYAWFTVMAVAALFILCAGIWQLIEEFLIGGP